MATAYLCLVCCIFLHGLLKVQPASTGLFRSRTEANVVLRQKRHNSGFFEEFMEGDIERECKEEICDLEEAREFFENDEKTMKFWQSYMDGDQCKSSPCQNGGECKDQMSAYTCECKTGFVGSDCEIVLARECDVDNGGCMHFCESVGGRGAECHCATGYRLAEDGMFCEIDGEWPCGFDRRVVRLNSEARTTLEHNSTNTNNTVTSNSSSSTDTTSPILTPTPAPTPLPTTTAFLRGSRISSSRSRLPLWIRQSLQPLPPVMAAKVPVVTNATTTPATNVNKRIVGGDAVFPGEIPWQVALVQRSTDEVFCGGSIVGELWVVTAAHCLEPAPEGSFFVRVGEHDVRKQEGTEQDLEVSKRYVHPLYAPRQSRFNHDVALLKLDQPIKFSLHAQPICLGPKAFSEALLQSGEMALVSGWGRLRYQGWTSSTLLKVELPYVERTECIDSSSERITYFMFCSGYGDGSKDACQGDSGGPHATRFRGTWFLTGIVSWGEECAKEGKYGVYTRISHYYRWLRYIMSNNREMLDDVVDL
ncbi:coagulation factor IXa [Engraulis encrasicolus]|uniref:coagulation factor IXa n=1 Tax=Engraulis encrasicolus TaxID=184585 RepID=UPI002FD2A8B7